MVYNKIQVAFGALKKITGPSLEWQYNEKQILIITGLDLPEYYAVDFCNEGDADTITMTASAAGVEIPDQFLLTGKKLVAYIVVVDGESVNTVGQITFPVNARARRTDISPEPAEQQQIDSLIGALSSGVTRAETAASEAEETVTEVGLDAERAETAANTAVSSAISASGSAGQAIASASAASTSATQAAESAYSASGSATSASQSATNAETAARRAEDALEEFTTPTASANTLSPDTPATADYANGHFTFGIPKGGDGVSPVFTVVDIQGGHRVTVTDAEGEHVFDVMDGVGNIQDVQINGSSIVDENGVANIPKATNNQFGLVKYGVYYGTYVSPEGGIIQVYPADNGNIKAGDSHHKPIVPDNQHQSAFYGLAKAAGDSTQSASSNPVGTYTDNAKNAIRAMLGVTDANGGMNIVNLSGTQITQVGADNTFYVCGELTDLTFNTPSTGITMIRFTSGTTPTVCSFPNVTSWMYDFDPDTDIEANKTYDISVLNGIGVAGWA